jgi:hypothetical protein
MKIAVGVALVLWLLCGLIGAWMMLEEDQSLRFKAVAGGPITLIRAVNQTEPVKFPGD